MNFRVETTARAERERDRCYEYILKRSPDGAARWVNAYQAAADYLKMNPRTSLAPESEDHDEEIWQKTFKTKKGLRYRLLYVVRGDTIFVVHVRGPGQNVMEPEDIELPKHPE